MGFYCEIGPGVGDVEHGPEDIIATGWLSKSGSLAIQKYSSHHSFYPMGAPICRDHVEAIAELVGRLEAGETPSGSYVSSQQQSQSQGGIEIIDPFSKSGSTYVTYAKADLPLLDEVFGCSFENQIPDSLGDLGDFSTEEFQAQSDGALFYKTTFGFRTIRFDSEKGFFLI